MTERRPRLLLFAALLAVVGLAFWLRLPGLADKPLHSDESVNGWFSLRLYWWNVYRYQPSDYHGPFLYYINLILFWLLGPSETSLRLGPAVFGGLIPLLLWPLRRWMGGLGILVSGLLLACAPAMVYFARTAIHEAYLLFFSLIWVIGLLHFLRRPRLAPALLAAVGACGAFCNKETAIITAGSLAAGLTIAWLFGRPNYDRVEGDRDLFGGRSQRQIVVSLVLRPWKALLAGVGVFFAGVVLFFSSFFSYSVSEDYAAKIAPLPEWSVGVGAFFHSFIPWFEHGTSGRNQGKDWDYFWILMADTQGLALALSVCAGCLALFTRHRFGLFLTGWSTSSLAVYSAIPYKTPWCVLNIDLPCFLLCGWLASKCIEWARDGGIHPVARVLSTAVPFVFLLPIIHLHGVSQLDNEARFDDDAVEWVYVQTERGFFDLVRDHLGVAAVDPDADGRGPDVVNVNGKNPIRWYTITRGWDHDRTRYFSWKKTSDVLPDVELLREAEIIVVVGPVKRRLSEILGETGLEWHEETYPLRPGWKVVAWYRQELWDSYQQIGGRASVDWSALSGGSQLIPPKPRRYR